MVCAIGLSKAISKSSIPWAGLNIRYAAIRAFVSIATWCVVPSPFAGGKRLSANSLSGLKHCPFQANQPCRNHKKNLTPNLLSHLTWPLALRQVRAWLEPFIMLNRYWRAFSPLPPPLSLQHLLDWLWHGNGINFYSSAKPCQQTTGKLVGTQAKGPSIQNFNSRTTGFPFEFDCWVIDSFQMTVDK